jgi:Domain of unknown function (DUF6438)
MNPVRRVPLVLIVALTACLATNSVPLHTSAEAQPPASAATSSPSVVMWDGCNSPYAPCTTYEITIYPDDRYELQGRRDVRTLGASSGQLPPGAWAKANAALDAANFDALPSRIDRKPDDPPCMTDAPGAHFRRTAADGSERSVFWSLGCRSDEMSALLNAMREAISYDQLIKMP